MDKVESSKLRKVKGMRKEKKEKKVKGQNWRKEKQRVREMMPQHGTLSDRHPWKQLTVLWDCDSILVFSAEQGPYCIDILEMISNLWAPSEIAFEATSPGPSL